MRVCIQPSKALCIPVKRPTNLARSPLLVGPRRKKTDRGQRSTFPSETSRFAHGDSRAQGFSTPLGRRRSSFPPPSPNLVRTHPKSATRLSAAVSLSLACHHLPKGTKLELGRGMHLGNTILNQPYRRRVSTDRLNREDSQSTASLEGEPGPTPAGKTLPHLVW